MAFQFVPNAEGKFEEGMRQTNPETGIEYIFVEGAWRPLGPKIEDEFEKLDERYVNIDGDTMTGQLKLEQTQLAAVKADGTQQYKINPNTSDYYTNSFLI